MNASIRNELEVLEGWLLNTVIWQKIMKFLARDTKTGTIPLEKAVLEEQVPEKRS